MAGEVRYRPNSVAVVTVSNFKEGLAWFNQKLGFETEYVIEEMPWAEVRTNVPGFNIGLGQGDDAGKPGGAVLSFVVEDIAAARKALEARGVAFDGAIMDTPGVVKLTDFHDPDGNHYMLAEVPNQG